MNVQIQSSTLEHYQIVVPSIQYATLGVSEFLRNRLRFYLRRS